MAENTKNKAALIFLPIAMIVAVLVFCHQASGSFIAETGTRPLGMGGAFTAVADGSVGALWNPAGLSQMTRREIASSYDSLYRGLGDNIGMIHLGYASPVFRNSALGLNMVRMQSDLYSETTLSLAFGQRLGAFRWGVAARGLSADYADNEYTKIDPLFQQYGNSIRGMSIDAGLLLSLGSLADIGIRVQNINRPRMTLSDTAESHLPLSVAGGIALRIDGIRPCLDVQLLDFSDRGSVESDIRFGIETWLKDNVGVRGGINLNALSLGASYRFDSDDASLRIDYAFRYPISTRWSTDSGLDHVPISGTYGSHQFTLSYSFGSILPKKEEKAITTFDPNLQEAVARLEEGDYQAAILVCERVLAEDPSDSEAYFLAGIARRKMGDLEKSIEMLQMAVCLAPRVAKYHYELAETYRAVGNETGNKRWHDRAMLEYVKTRMIDSKYGDTARRIQEMRSK